MRKTLISMTVGLVALFVLAGPAMAGRQWCAKDPIVSLNGEQVQILVAVPDEMQAAVIGPIAVTIKNPAGVTQTLVATDSGFNGYGETVTFGTRAGTVAADGSFEAQIKAVVPVDVNILLAANIPVTGTTIPMQMTIITGSTTLVAEGLSSGLTRVVTVAP